MNLIDRREAIKRLSLLVGGTLSASTASAILAGCSLPGGTEHYEFETLTPAQQEFVAAIADAIIPATDTPGGRGVGVHQFIDLMLSGWMEEPDKDRFLDGLTELGRAFEASNGRDFGRASIADQISFLEPLDHEAAAARRQQQPIPFFGSLKELVVTGYYTSEIGATQELRHQMIFEKYDGNVEISPGHRAWSGRD